MSHEQNYKYLYKIYKIKYLNLKNETDSTIGGGSSDFVKMGFSKADAKLYADNLNSDSEKKIKEAHKQGVDLISITHVTSDLVKQISQLKKTKTDKTVKKNSISKIESEIITKLNNLIENRRNNLAYLEQNNINVSTFFNNDNNYFVNKFNIITDNNVFKKYADMFKDLIYLFENKIIYDINFKNQFKDIYLNIDPLFSLKDVQIHIINLFRKKINTRIFLQINLFNKLILTNNEYLNDNEFNLLIHIISLYNDPGWFNGFTIISIIIEHYSHYFKRFKNNLKLLEELFNTEEYLIMRVMYLNKIITDPKQITELSDEQIKSFIKLFIIFKNSYNSDSIIYFPEICTKIFKLAKEIGNKPDSMKLFTECIDSLRMKNIRISKMLDFDINMLNYLHILILENLNIENIHKILICFSKNKDELNFVTKLSIKLEYLKTDISVSVKSNDEYDIINELAGNFFCEYIRLIITKISNDINNDKLKIFIEYSNKLVDNNKLVDSNEHLTFAKTFIDSINDSNKFKFLLKFIESNIKFSYFNQYIKLSDEKKEKIIKLINIKYDNVNRNQQEKLMIFIDLLHLSEDRLINILEIVSSYKRYIEYLPGTILEAIAILSDYDQLKFYIKLINKDYSHKLSLQIAKKIDKNNNSKNKILEEILYIDDLKELDLESILSVLLNENNNYDKAYEIYKNISVILTNINKKDLLYAIFKLSGDINNGQIKNYIDLIKEGFGSYWAMKSAILSDDKIKNLISLKNIFKTSDENIYNKVIRIN
jgi:hypothetical protein